MGVLVAIEGELKGQIFPLASGVNEIGRLETSHVRLSSMKISRQHAQVIHSDGHFVIKALNEKNPTYLNDEATRGDALNDGDLIRLGHTTLKFRTV